MTLGVKVAKSLMDIEQTREARSNIAMMRRFNNDIKLFVIGRIFLSSLVSFFAKVMG